MRWVLAIVCVARVAAAGADSSYAAATAAYSAKLFDDAAAQLEVFVTSFPEDDRIGEVSGMLMDALARQQPVDEARIERAIDAMLPLEKITGGRRYRLARLRTELVSRRAQLLSHGHPRDAARLFADIAKDDPEKAKQAELWFNAGVQFELAGDEAEALAAYRAVGTAVPLLTSKAEYRSARLEEDAHPAVAAEIYMKISKEPCQGIDCKFTADARFNAAQLLLAAGDPKQALAAFESYGKDFATAADADNAAFFAGHAAELAGDDRAAERSFDAYAKRPKATRRALALLHAGYAASRLGERVKAEHAFATVEKIADGPLLGEVKFAQAELVARDAGAIALTVRTDKLVAALKERNRRVEAALIAFEHVAEAKDAYWTIAALDRAAHVYDDYASALLALAPPDGLTQTERESFNREIDTFASGVTNKITDGYRAAYEMALAAQIPSEHAVDAFRQLSRFDPKMRQREARDGFREEPLFQPAIIESEQDPSLDTGR